MPNMYRSCSKHTSISLASEYEKFIKHRNPNLREGSTRNQNGSFPRPNKYKTAGSVTKKADEHDVEGLPDIWRVDTATVKVL